MGKHDDDELYCARNDIYDDYYDFTAAADDERDAAVELRAACDRYLAATDDHDDAGPNLDKLRAAYIDALAGYDDTDNRGDYAAGFRWWDARIASARALVAALRRNVKPDDT